MDAFNSKGWMRWKSVNAFDMASAMENLEKDLCI